MKIIFQILIFFCFLTAKINAQVASEWYYSNNGGFEISPYQAQETAPGMVLMDGYTQFINNDDKLSIKKTQPPFYLSKYEETNGQYLEYLKWIKNCYSKATYQKALPDTTVWLKEHLPDTLKDHLVRSYFRSPEFKDYPVVGISPEQILKYAEWKTDRMNEMILIREGLLTFDYYPTDSTTIFSTETYLSGKWRGSLKQKLPSFDQVNPERDVRMEDGIFLPAYRMTTEEEFICAANVYQKKIKKSKIYDNKKFDKKNYFGHLYIKPKKSKPLLKIELLAVYNTASKDGLVKGLFGNVSEWVVDSAGKAIAIGASWKDDLRSYTYPGKSSYPFYDYYKFMESAKKEHPKDFDETVEERSHVSAIMGFRLAMDYNGYISPTSKRR